MTVRYDCFEYGVVWCGGVWWSVYGILWCDVMCGVVWYERESNSAVPSTLEEGHGIGRYGTEKNGVEHYIQFE